MNYQRILIVKLSAIGDVIHALPVARALKEAFPEVRISWVVEQPAAELVRNHPDIDEVILFEKSRCRSLGGLLQYLPALARELKGRRFDLALDLQGLLKSGLIALLSGAPRRLVYCNPRELSGWISQKVCGPHQQGHIVERYLDVVRALGGPVTTVDFGIGFSEAEVKAAGEVLTAANWPGGPYVVLIPGANWVNKRWPLQHFAALAERLFKQGICCILTGGASDQELARQIREGTKAPLWDVTGKTSLKQLAWIIKNARVAVGGDTGPLHLAVAVGTPTVALLGPTDPTRNGPYGSGHRVLVTSRDCVGCWRRQCAKRLDCLAAIPVEEVYQEVVSLYKLS
ncbi:MAG TPA: lipopolysaccharide heptosyltransferase I [Bacillota bacterium]